MKRITTEGTDRITRKKLTPIRVIKTKKMLLKKAQKQPQKKVQSNKNQTLRVQLKDRSYDIHIACECPQLEQIEPENKVFIISDLNVEALYLETFIGAAKNVLGNYSIKPGEQSKSLSQAEDIFTAMIKAGADRATVVIALGGGVVGDLAGFVAATFMRGVPFYQCPTTLLAMVDSSVGGKVAVNHKLGKNIIGNFYQPKGVYISTDTLKTLPKREFAAGLAEVIKYGIIRDAPFFTWLEENKDKLLNLDQKALSHIINISAKTKADIVSQDECERNGLRALLNLGHTFAHAEETLSGYGKILHGEAVAAGMVTACHVSEKLGKMPIEECHRVIKLIEGFDLPTNLTQLNCFESFWKCMEGDKKNQNGKVHFIIPESIGVCNPPVAIEKNIIEEALA